MADPTDPNAAPGITPDMAKDAADLKNTLQQMRDFAKQMAEAINSMSKPMDHMNDMTKAIKENFMETQKTMKDVHEKLTLSVDNQKKMKELQGDGLKHLADSLYASKDLTEEGKAQLQNMNEIIDNHNQISDIYRKEAEINIGKAEATRQHNLALEAQKGIWAKINEAATQYNEKISVKRDGDGKPMLDANGKPQATAWAQSSASFSEVGFGKRNVQEVMGGIKESLASLIPAAGGIGGLVGLMIAGRVEDAKFDAIGATAAQQFDRVGGSVKGFSEQMGKMAREVQANSLGSAEDIAAVAGAFASSGVRASEAMKHVDGFSSILGNNLVAASLAADKSLELPAGTMAKMSGTMSQQFGRSAKDSFTALVSVGEAAKSSGMDMVTFMQQTMEASSALRLLHANGVQVGDMQLHMAEKMKANGMDPKYAQQYAAAGTQSASGAMAGLGVGLSAVIGERMGLAPGGGGGLDAWYAMKSGQQGARAAGKEELSPLEVAKQLGSLARENSKSRSEQVYFLTQIAGTSVQGAEAMLDVGDLKPGQKPSKQAMEAISEGMKSESEKTSSIDKSLKLIKDGVLNVGAGLLGMIVNGLKLLYDAVIMLGAKFANMLGFGDGKTFQNAQDKLAYDAKLASNDADRLVKGIGEVGEGAGTMIQGMRLGGWSIDNWREQKDKDDAHDAEIAKRDAAAAATASTAHTKHGGTHVKVKQTKHKTTVEIHHDDGVHARGKAI